MRAKFCVFHKKNKNISNIFEVIESLVWNALLDIFFFAGKNILVENSTINAQFSQKSYVPINTIHQKCAAFDIVMLNSIDTHAKNLFFRQTNKLEGALFSPISNFTPHQKRNLPEKSKTYSLPVQLTQKHGFNFMQIRRLKRCG